MSAPTDGTPGTLKAALVLWMLAMAGLLGWSIVNAQPEPIADAGHGAPEASHGTAEPSVPSGLQGTKSPPRALSPSPQPSVSVSAVTIVWKQCTALPGVRAFYLEGTLRPANETCERMQDARGSATISVLFQFEDVPFEQRAAALAAEDNPDAIGEPVVARAGGREARTISYRRDASTYVDCPGPSIEYAYFVDAPGGRTLDAVFFACEDEAEVMREVHDGIMSRLRFV